MRSSPRVALFFARSLCYALSLCGCRPALAPSPTRRPASSPPTASPSGGVRWTDVTEAAGIRFRHENGASGRKYLPETMGSGGAFLDFDGDGWLDLFLVNSRSLPGEKSPRSALPCLLHNRGDGTFEDVTAGSGLDHPVYRMGCAAADYDGDGRVDLYVSACLDSPHLYHNVGGGKFRDVTQKSGLIDHGWGTSCAWLDYDRDGYPDLFVCRYVRYRLGETDRNCFTPDGMRMYCDPRRVPPDTCLLYHNLGGSRFRDVSTVTGIASKAAKALGVAVCDVDGDRWPDLFVANDTEPNFLYHNVAGPGGRRFEEIGLEAGVAMPESGEPSSGMGIDLADLNNDGRYAMLVSNFSGEGLALYQQDRPRALTFTERAYEAGLGPVSLNLLGFGLLFFDYDNDGRLDAFVANGHVQPEVHNRSTELTYAERPLLFHNEGKGQFTEVGRLIGGPFAREQVGRGAAYGDFNNDGNLDLLVTNNGGPAELLRNDGPGPVQGRAKAHWLEFRLVGRPPNTDALGAQVTVRAGSLVQRRTVRTGSSYLSQSMTRLHFGLGAHARADTVEVQWPGADPVRLHDDTVDHLITLYQSATEPSSHRHSGRKSGT